MKNKNIILHGNVASKRIIEVGSLPGDVKSPILKSKEYSTKFRFSFQYFKQIKYFGIAGVNSSWYFSLINRLQELSKKDWQSFEKDVLEKRSFRYHEIDWGGRNVPIQRSDLDWIDKDYLNNAEEFPIIQFHVSRALGRVVGFWDEDHVFQIILLDPKHNIQPSTYNDYKVDDTYFMSCEYSSLIADISKLQSKIKTDCSCSTCSELKKIPSKLNQTNLLIAFIDDSYKAKLDGLEYAIKDIIEMGILSISE